MLCRLLLALATMLVVSSGQSFTLPPNPPGPNVGVEAKCLYHTQTSVNYCALGNVVNCARVDFQAFSYEGCDCNKTIETGVDLIMVFDQLPHRGTPPTIAESNATWNRLTIVGATTLARTVGFQDNTIGFIRPTATGCDLFGFNNDTFMRPGDDFVNSLELFGWKDVGACVEQAGSPPCAPKQTRHLDCVEFARNKLVSRDPSRRKIIFSLRHSQDSGTFVMKNEPENNLFYFVTTAVQQGLTGDISLGAPNSPQSQFDFGNFERKDNHFILGKAGDRLLAYTLDPTVDPDLGSGYVRCNNTIVQAFLGRDFNGEAPSQVSNMICTIFPTAPTLAWWTLDAFNIGDQSFIRGTVSAFTSWLCQLNQLTSSPSASPTSNPTKNPTKNPTQNPTSKPTSNPTKNPTNDPSSKPTQNPTKNPTQNPTANPSKNPTDNPSVRPTGKPTASPTANPTKNPTAKPTSKPSASPTANPTFSPTTCQQRDVPPFARRNCASANGCTGSSGVVTVGNNGQPASVTTNTVAGTTTVCYDLNLVNNGGTSAPPCDVTNEPMTGVSFITDECCPAPTMEFLTSVSVSSGGSSVSVNRAACVQGDSTVAFNNQCTRTSRRCVANPGASCSVLNLNNLNVLPSPSVRYCITVQGANFDVESPPNELDANVRGKAKFCFERGSTTPIGQTNVCTCVEVGFISSERLCNNTPSPTAKPTTDPTKNPTAKPSQKPTANPTNNPTAKPTQNPTANPTAKPTTNPTQNPTGKPSSNPTKNPTSNPTANPTLSPTTCKQSRVPDFQRKDCAETNGCTGSSGLVSVGNGGEPTATLNGDGTTTVCYDLNLAANPASPCDGAGALTGVSLIIDECCPTPSMQFFETVSISNGSSGVSVNREECVEGNSGQSGNSQCTRTSRVCQSDSSQQCTVLNLNNLALTTNAQYCIKVQGEFDVVAPAGELDPNVRGKAKFCFERGSTGPSGNVCTCMEVGFIESPRLCKATFSPSSPPTPPPDCLIPPVFPRDSSCKSKCKFATSNWNVSFVDRVVSTDPNGSKSTTFTYSASSLRKCPKSKSDSRGWSRSSKKKRRLSTWSTGASAWSSTPKPSTATSGKSDGKSSSKKVSKKSASKKTSGSKSKPSKKSSSPSKKTSADSGSGKPSKKSASKKSPSKPSKKSATKKLSKKIASGSKSKKTSKKVASGKPSKKLATKPSKKSNKASLKKTSKDGSQVSSKKSATSKPSKKTASKKSLTSKPSKKSSNKSDGGKPSKKSTAKPSKKSSKPISKKTSKDGSKASKKSSTSKPSKKRGSKSKDGKPSKKTATKKSPTSKPSKKSSNKSDSGKPTSKKTSSKKTGAGKKVSKKTSKKQGTSPCDACLDTWALRLDECCGVGVLEDAVANGLAKVTVDGTACGESYRCKIKSNGKNGDVIVVSGTEPSTLSITVPGDVPLSRGGSVCAKSRSACACKRMMTPNTCLLPTRPPTSKPNMKPSLPPTRKPTKASKKTKTDKKKKDKKGSKSGSKSKGDAKKKPSGKGGKLNKGSKGFAGSKKNSGGSSNGKKSSKNEGKKVKGDAKSGKKTYSTHN